MSSLSSERADAKQLPKPVEQTKTPRAESKDTTPSILIAELAFKKTQEETERVDQELAAERLAVLLKCEENEKLRQELLVRESQSDQLRLSNTMLEDQIGKQSAMLDSLKQSTGKADEALEVRTLKICSVGNAHELTAVLLVIASSTAHGWGCSRARRASAKTQHTRRGESHVPAEERGLHAPVSGNYPIHSDLETQ